MASSLRDIPGAQRPTRRKADRGLWTPSRSTKLDLTPGSLRIGRSRRRGSNRPARQVDLFLWALVLGAAGVAAWLGHAFWSATRVDVAMAGVESGQALKPDHAAELAIVLTFASADELFRGELTVDGVDVMQDLAPKDATQTTVEIRPQSLVTSELVEHALDEGEHVIKLSVGRLLLGDSQFVWRYSVDSVAPVLDVPSSLAPVPIAEPVTVRGTVEDGASLTYEGKALDNDGGRFEVEFDTPPAGALHFTAIDEAGNETSAQVVVPVIYPETSRAVHVSGAAWANDELRGGVLDLIDSGLIDTVELDLKDESGIISYRSKVPEAVRIGAVSGEYDLEEAVRTLERKGVRVIGRLVAFRDSIYAESAWSAGRTDEVLQTPEGGMLTTYGGFTNYAHADVRQYNLDIALEAVSFGVKDILWDYIRRPEGDPATMVVPGLVGPSSDSVTSFLAETQAQLTSAGPTRGRQCSASRPLPVTASPRTCQRWPRSSTTSHRCSIPPTGGRACTECPTRSSSRATSSPSHWRTSSGSPPTPACGSFPGSRTSHSSACRTAMPKYERRSTPPRLLASTVSCCGIPMCATTPAPSTPSRASPARPQRKREASSAGATSSSCA